MLMKIKVKNSVECATSSIFIFQNLLDCLHNAWAFLQAKLGLCLGPVQHRARVAQEAVVVVHKQTPGAVHIGIPYEILNSRRKTIF
jgi:hypothetical protein